MAKERLSNIESLRIVAIVLIVMMHGTGFLLGTENVLDRILLTAINSAGNMGVTLYILISGFFGIHFRWSRLWVLWSMALFYSLTTYVVGIYLLDDVFTWQSFYEALTPITSRRWWFLTCYVIIFCLAPFLNRIVNSLSRREMGMLLFVLMFFFVLSPTFLRHSLTDDMWGKGLPNLITAYLVGQYLSKHSLPSVMVSHSGMIALAAFLVAFSGSFLVGYIEPKATTLLCKDNNLLMVTEAVALFCWAQCHEYHSSMVNYLAGFAFPLYLVNTTALRFLKPMLLQRCGQYDFWAYYVLVIMIILLLAFFVELFRRLFLSKIIGLVADRIDRYDL